MNMLQISLIRILQTVLYSEGWHLYFSLLILTLGSAQSREKVAFIDHKWSRQRVEWKFKSYSLLWDCYYQLLCPCNSSIRYPSIIYRPLFLVAWPACVSSVISIIFCKLDVKDSSSCCSLLSWLLTMNTALHYPPPRPLLAISQIWSLGVSEYLHSERHSTQSNEYLLSELWGWF